MESSRENSFWKHNGRVPGRPSPKKENKLQTKSAKGPIGSTSFQDFQNSVRDAWDIGDDEFCIVSEMSSKYAVWTFSFVPLTLSLRLPSSSIIFCVL